MTVRLTLNALVVGLMLWLAPIDPRWWWERAEGRWGLVLLGGWGLLEWAALARQARIPAVGAPVPVRVRMLDRAVVVAGIAALTIGLRGWSFESLAWGRRAGLLMVYAAGLGLRGSAMAALGPRFSQHVLGTDPPVRHGPYRWFRHPGYVGLLLIWSALMGWWGSVWGMAVIWGVMAPLLWWRGRWEKTNR